MATESPKSIVVMMAESVLGFRWIAAPGFTSRLLLISFFCT